MAERLGRFIGQQIARDQKLIEYGRNIDQDIRSQALKEVRSLYRKEYHTPPQDVRQILEAWAKAPSLIPETQKDFFIQYGYAYLRGEEDFTAIIEKIDAHQTNQELPTPDPAVPVPNADELMEGAMITKGVGLVLQLWSRERYSQMQIAAQGEGMNTPPFTMANMEGIRAGWEQIETEFVEKFADVLFPNIEGINWEREPILKQKAVDYVFAVRALFIRSFGISGYVELINSMRTADYQTDLAEMPKAIKGISSLWSDMMANGEGKLADVYAKHAGIFLNNGIPIEALVEATMPIILKTKDGTGVEKMKSVEKGVWKMMDYLYGDQRAKEVLTPNGKELVLKLNNSNDIPDIGNEEFTLSDARLTPDLIDGLQNGTIDWQIVFDNQDPIDPGRTRPGELLFSEGIFDREDTAFGIWFNHLANDILPQSGIDITQIIGGDLGGDLRPLAPDHPQLQLLEEKHTKDIQSNPSLDLQQKASQIEARTLTPDYRSEYGKRLLLMSETRDGMWPHAVMLMDILGLSERMAVVDRAHKPEWLDKWHRKEYDEGYQLGISSDRDTIDAYKSFWVAWKRSSLHPIMVGVNGNPKATRARWMNRLDPSSTPVILGIKFDSANDEAIRIAKGLIEGSMYDFKYYTTNNRTAGYNRLRVLLSDNYDGAPMTDKRREKIARIFAEDKTYEGINLQLSPEATWLSRGEALSKISWSTTRMKQDLAIADFSDFQESTGCKYAPLYRKGALGLAACINELNSVRTILFGEENKAWKPEGKYGQAAIEAQMAMEQIRQDCNQAMTEYVLTLLGTPEPQKSFNPDDYAEALGTDVVRYVRHLAKLPNPKEAAELFKKIVESTDKAVMSMPYINAQEKEGLNERLFAEIINMLDDQVSRIYLHEEAKKGWLGQEGSRRKRIEPTKPGIIRALRIAGYDVIYPYLSDPQDFEGKDPRVQTNNKKRKCYVIAKPGHLYYQEKGVEHVKTKSALYGHRGIPRGLLRAVTEYWQDKLYLTENGKSQFESIVSGFSSIKNEVADINYANI